MVAHKKEIEDRLFGRKILGNGLMVGGRQEVNAYSCETSVEMSNSLDDMIEAFYDFGDLWLERYMATSLKPKPCRRSSSPFTLIILPLLQSFCLWRRSWHGWKKRGINRSDLICVINGRSVDAGFRKQEIRLMAPLVLSKQHLRKSSGRFPSRWKLAWWARLLLLNNLNLPRVWVLLFSSPFRCSMPICSPEIQTRFAPLIA